MKELKCKVMWIVSKENLFGIATLFTGMLLFDLGASHAEQIVFNFANAGAPQSQLDFTASGNTFQSPILRAAASQFPAGGLPSLLQSGNDGLGVDTRDPGSDTFVFLIDNRDAADE